MSVEPIMSARDDKRTFIILLCSNNSCRAFRPEAMYSSIRTLALRNDSPSFIK